MRSKYRNILVLIFIVFMTASITYAARFLMQKPYLIAAREIACGTKITREDVRFYTPHPVGDYIPFAGIYDVNDLIGNYIGVNMAQGNAILTMFVHTQTDTLKHCKPR